MYRVLRQRGIAAVAFALASLMMPTMAEAGPGRAPADGPFQIALIPRDTFVRFPVDIVFAGSSGFLTRIPPVYGHRFAWTDYNSGQTVPTTPDVRGLFSNGTC